MFKMLLTLTAVFLAGICTNQGLASANQADETAQSIASQDKPVAAFFMRASVVLRAEDIVPLQQGLSLMIGSSQGGMTIVKYDIVDGKIVYAATSGSINDKDRKAIEKTIAKMQKKL